MVSNCERENGSAIQSQFRVRWRATLVAAAWTIGSASTEPPPESTHLLQSSRERWSATRLDVSLERRSKIARANENRQPRRWPPTGTEAEAAR